MSKTILLGALVLGLVGCDAPTADDNAEDAAPVSGILVGVDPVTSGIWYFQIEDEAGVEQCRVEMPFVEDLYDCDGERLSVIERLDASGPWFGGMWIADCPDDVTLTISYAADDQSEASVVMEQVINDATVDGLDTCGATTSGVLVSIGTLYGTR